MWVCPHCHLTFRNERIGRCPAHGVELIELDYDPLIGRVVDRYQVLARLGGGAMGSVYRAKHAVLDRLSAIKILFGEFAHDQNLRKRFEREAKSVSQIRHPNVVEVSDFGATPEGLTFLVMDYIDGRPLDEVIEESAPLSPRETADIARQIAAGLQEAHSQGFVHRDVKPPNVMVTPGSGLVRILDFGLVSLLYQNVETERLTIEGQLVGTPMYMSPEQTVAADVGPRSDLYSLGVMMFEMLTGRPPFHHDGRIAMMFAHMHEQAPNAPELGPLGPIVLRLLEKKPEDRFENGAALIGALDELELPVSLGPEAVQGRTHIIPELVQGVSYDTDPSLPPPPEPDFGDDTELSEVSERELAIRKEARLSVLILEDPKAGSSGSIARIDHEFSVRHLTEVEAAVHMLDHEQVDAIVVDLELSAMKDMRALKLLRATAGETPIVVLSPRAPEDLAIEAAVHGADEFLAKAFTTPVSLARTIRFAVARARSREMRTAQPSAATLELPSEVVVPNTRRTTPLPNKQSSNPMLIAIAVALLVLVAVGGVFLARAPGAQTTVAATQALWRIESSPPGASVTVGGQHIGKTPILLSRPVPEEPVEVILRKTGYLPWSRRVAASDGRLVVNADLEASTAPR